MEWIRPAFPASNFPCRVRRLGRIVRRPDMNFTFTMKCLRFVSFGIAVIALLLVEWGTAFAQEKLTEPVYRVANETPAAQPAATAQDSANGAASTPAKTVSRTALDFTQRKDEHQRPE